MEKAIPLVDELLTELEGYQCFLSIDAASDLGRDDGRTCSPCVCVRVRVWKFRVVPYAIRTQEFTHDFSAAH